MSDSRILSTTNISDDFYKIKLELENTASFLSQKWYKDQRGDYCFSENSQNIDDADENIKILFLIKILKHA